MCLFKFNLNKMQPDHAVFPNRWNVTQLPISTCSGWLFLLPHNKIPFPETPVDILVCSSVIVLKPTVITYL